MGVNAAERFERIVESLPPGWSQAVVDLTLQDRDTADRAARMLGSLVPGRTGLTFRLAVSAAGADGPSVDAVERILRRIDEQGIDARLTLASEPAVHAAGEETHGLAAAWDAIESGLAPDWADLHLELRLASSEDIDRAALELAPVNPSLEGERPPALRFRAARRFGYGASPGMTRRALERLDQVGVRGRLELLRAISESAPVLTQGPVWRDRGRSV